MKKNVNARYARAYSDKVNVTTENFLHNFAIKKHTISAFVAQQKPRARVFKWRQKIKSRDA